VLGFRLGVGREGGRAFVWLFGGGGWLGVGEEEWKVWGRRKRSREGRFGFDKMDWGGG